MPPADLGVNAHILGFNGRGEGAGGRSVIIDVPSENLWRRMGQEQIGGGGAGHCGRNIGNMAADFFTSGVSGPFYQIHARQGEQARIPASTGALNSEWQEERMGKRGRSVSRINKRLHIFETPNYTSGSDCPVL